MVTELETQIKELDVIPEVQKGGELCRALFVNVGRVIQTELGTIIMEPNMGPINENGVRCGLRDGCTYPPNCKKSCAATRNDQDHERD